MSKPAADRAGGPADNPALHWLLGASTQPMDASHLTAHSTAHCPHRESTSTSTSTSTDDQPHSLGGIYAQAFQALYPEEVAGIAFVEGSPRDNFATARGQRTLTQAIQIFAWLPLAARLGFLHAAPFCNEADDFPERAGGEIHARCAAVNGWLAGRAELQAITTSAPIGDLSALPIAVVSGGDHVAADAEWARKQSALAGLSANSSYEIVAGADHGSVLKDEHDAHRSSLAIFVGRTRYSEAVQLSTTVIAAAALLYSVPF